MPIEQESPEEYGYDLIRYNLSESSVSDRSFGGLGLQLPDLTLLYGKHRGSREMRELIAAESKTLQPDDVLITAGAAGALFIIATALLDRGDHLLVVRPNYATNIETPRAIGCDIGFHDLTLEDGFALDLDRLANAITPRTKLISVTCPHNPTGVVFGLETLEALIALAERRGCRLLVDETYRDLAYAPPLPVAASLSPAAISVSSLSKAYGVPGVRMGWLITRDPVLQETFLAAKEQISICGSAIDEWVGLQVMRRKAEMLAQTLPEMRRRLALVSDWIAAEPLLEWVPPAGGVVCFPRMKSDPPGGLAAFYKRLLKTHGAYVGPGHWFEMSDRHFRLGYGWPTAEELEGGLKAISAALRG